GLNRAVLSARYTILAANGDRLDFPTEDADPERAFVRPYGDATIDSGDAYREINFLGTPSTVLPWSDATLNDNSDVAFEQWLEMLESNLRYTP
ncbi:MAG: hypothetical protein AAGH64_10610, partial [Planctomycetota bacterium]